MEFVKVLVSVKSRGIKEVVIQSKISLIDVEVYILVEKMFPYWIGVDLDQGSPILKDEVESITMYRF